MECAVNTEDNRKKQGEKLEIGKNNKIGKKQQLYSPFCVTVSSLLQSFWEQTWY